MVKLLTILLSSLLIVSSALAIPSEIVYEKVIPGAENFSDIDPILDINNQLTGFVFTDPVNNQVVVYYKDIDSIITLSIPGGVKETVVRSNLDSLIIYSLTVSPPSRPQITMNTLTDTEITSTQYEVRTFSGSWGSPATAGSEEFLSFKIHKNSNLKFESSYLVHDNIPTMGYEDYTIATSIIYELDLQNELYRDDVTRISTGNLFPSIGQDTVTCLDYYFKYDYSDYNNPNYGGWSSTTLSLTENSGNQLFEKFAEYKKIFDYLVSNYKPTTTQDELIIYGDISSLDDSYETKLNISCYSFENYYPELLWYNDKIDTMEIIYTFHKKDLIVGFRENRLIYINFLNGEITDSTYFNQNVELLTCYEINSFQESQLQALFKSYDTVFITSFDIVTGISENFEQPDIPATFTLFQNHPNPFNGDTRLEFSNEQYQFLSLKVYNILGQEIKSIAERQFSPGRFSFYWDGKNEEGYPQSTGVYFARLESVQSTQMIKLIYLK